MKDWIFQLPRKLEQSRTSMILLKTLILQIRVWRTAIFHCSLTVTRYLFLPIILQYRWKMRKRSTKLQFLVNWLKLLLELNLFQPRENRVDRFPKSRKKFKRDRKSRMILRAKSPIQLKTYFRLSSLTF